MNIFIQIMLLSLVQRHQNFVYVLPKEVSTTCRRKKNTFLRCEDLRVSWDLNAIYRPSTGDVKVFGQFCKNIFSQTKNMSHTMSHTMSHGFLVFGIWLFFERYVVILIKMRPYLVFQLFDGAGKTLILSTGIRDLQWKSTVFG